MQEAALPPGFAAIRKRHSRIFAIVSPPRCCSTAFARVFWEHPSVGYYSHEPFEVLYFDGASLQDVIRGLEQPLALDGVKSLAANARSQALAIKEMPYQVGRRFPLLAGLADEPLIFLIRDPRLSIASRMKKKQQVGDDPLFPHVETGWYLLADQIRYCRERGIDHIILAAKDFRSRPARTFRQVFKKFNMRFHPRMLRWRSCSEAVNLDNLDGRHKHLYERVLKSTGILPEEDSVPPLDWFPSARGFRNHVRECLRIYRQLLQRTLQMDGERLRG